MTSGTIRNLPATKTFSAPAGLSVLYVGFLVTAVWLFQVGTLITVLSSPGFMKVNAALAFIGAGSSLLFKLPHSKIDSRS